MFSAIKYEKYSLKLLDQRILPNQEEWLSCETLEEVADAIEEMVVRGAPAIGCTVAFGLVLDLANHKGPTWGDYRSRFSESVERLAATRPTAVNLFKALEAFKQLTSSFNDIQPKDQSLDKFHQLAQSLYDDDLRTCQLIGEHGQSLFKRPCKILTHCNTGALATAGYGTALGVIRSLHQHKKLEHVYVDETRPFMQGTRLTAYELEKEEIPYSIQVDSAAAVLMENGKVDGVVVGADRISANGDTANKIGTYSLAIMARYHEVPFYVAAPISTFDLSIKSGREIKIEQRNHQEITHYKDHQVAPEGAQAFNPSFDVTPHTLISGIICENGVAKPPFNHSLAEMTS